MMWTERKVRILVVCYICGAILVSLGQPLAANVIWSLSNPILAWHNRGIGQHEQAVMFGTFAVIAWIGVWNLG